MTTNDPTGDPHSVERLRTSPSDEKITGEFHIEKTTDAVELPEGRESKQLKAQEEDRTEAEPDKEEEVHGVADPNPDENIDKDEANVGRPPVEEDVTNVEEGVETGEDAASSEAREQNNGVEELETDKKHAPRMMSDPPEQQDNSSAPASIKEAVQDPGLVDIAPVDADNGVIDVDAFDDDVPEDEEPAPSLAPDETMTEPENDNEPFNHESHTMIVNDVRSEAVDLTASPSIQPNQSPTLEEKNENMDTEDAIVMERQAELPEGVIDVDEPERQEEEIGAVEAADRMLIPEDMNSIPDEEDEKHGKGTTDIETASADLNADLNGEDVLAGVAPVEYDALDTAGQGEADNISSPERVKVVERDEKEEQTVEESRIGSEDDGIGVEGREATGDKDGGINFMVATHKPETEDEEPPKGHEEPHDDETDDDVASGRLHRDREGHVAKEEASPSMPTEAAGFEKEEHEKMAIVGQTEVPVEDTRLSDFQSQEPSKDFIAEVQGEDATSQANQLTEKVSHMSSDKKVALDAPAEGHIASNLVDREPQRVGKKEEARADASDYRPSAVKENQIVKTGTSDAGVSDTADVCETPDPLVLERRDTAEMRSNAPATDLKSPKEHDKEEFGKDVATRTVEHDNEVKTGPDSVVPLVTESDTPSSKQREQEPGESAKETENRTEAALVHKSTNSGASDGVRRPLVRNEENPPEESKSVGTGHLAPMFGIQLSGPIKSGPVTFSSPPSFPRYSLNPQAAPFVPAKLQRNESTKQPIASKKAPSSAPSIPSKEAEVTGIEAHAEVKKDNKPKAVEADDLPDHNLKTPTTTLFDDTASTVKGKSISTDKAPPPAVLAEPAIDTSKEASAQSAPQIKSISVAKPPLKKTAQKKVSFVTPPTVINKGEEPMSESEREQSIETGSRSIEKGQRVEGKGEQAALSDAKPEHDKQRHRGKRVAGIDDTKGKQTMLQVQTDEGLRREVKNVTVAMRQGNSKVRPERKKFTVRLTTGAEEKAKLQFFKASGPSSLKLYASLDSSRDYLRVRKVTNRQYVMSVAKVAPPGDDAADIIVKYFLHFDEQDTFEEMYSQCVANLQTQPKPTARAKKNEESPKTSQKVVEEMKEDTNRLPKTAGVKRSAENVSTSQVSKKSKLLADKKKLLDKMAALLRKKEQKGSSVTNERRTQPISKASSDNVSGYGTTAKNVTSSAHLKSKEVDAKPASTNFDSTNTRETTATPEGSMQPLRKRTAEVVGNENASKRARLPSSHSTKGGTGIARPPLLDGQNKHVQKGSSSIRGEAKDELRDSSADNRKAPLIRRADHAKRRTDLPLKHSGDRSGDKDVPSSDSTGQQRSKDSEALVKVTRELKQSEIEKKALQRELDSRNRQLDAEKEKSLRVLRESEDAWQRIVKTFEALSTDMGRLRREDMDRSLESLTRCEPSSSEDFFDRLHSFRPSTWAAFENREIGALECALKGWYNCGPGKIRSSEGAEIALIESFDDANCRQGEVERVSSLLREGHCLLSGWIGQSCPESFRTLEGSQRALSKEQLRANVQAFRKAGLGTSETRFAWGASALLLSDDICEKLAAYNWNMDGECLRCSWCNRRAVVSGESRFDAKSTHYTFCPFQADDWKTSVVRNAATLGPGTSRGEGNAVMND